MPIQTQLVHSKILINPIVVYSVSSYSQYGETVLMTACMIKDLNLVQELLEQNADPNIKRDVCAANCIRNCIHALVK